MAHSNKIRQALDKKTESLGISTKGKQDKSKKHKKARRARAASSPPPPPPSPVLVDAIAYKQPEVDDNSDEDLKSTCQEALTKEVENLSPGQEGDNLLYVNQEGKGLMAKLSQMVCDARSLEDIVKGH